MCVVGEEFVDFFLAVIEQFGDAVLQRGGDGEGQELMGRSDADGEVWWGNGPSDLPACE